MRVLFFGDSITQGFWGIEGGWVERIHKHYDRLALRDLTHNTQPSIFNLGISGDTTRSLLRRIVFETQARSWQNDPTVVVVAIGTNDDLFESGQQWVGPKEFQENLERLIALLKPLAHDILFVGNPACDESKTTPVAWGDFSYTNRELQRSERVMQAVADAHGLAFVPIFEQFKARLDAGANFLADGLHPNDSGHQCIAGRVLPILDTVIARVKNSTS